LKVHALICILSIAVAVVAQSTQTGPDIIRSNIAVLDLVARSGLEQDEILTISDRFRGALIETGTFTVIERSQMDAILKEQGFQQTGACSEASCIVEIGQLLAVHKMVGGSIGKVGRLYSINLKVIDVATGAIIQQINRDIQCSKEDLVSKHIASLAREMAGTEKQYSKGKRRGLILIPVGIAVAGGGALLATMLLKDDTSNPVTTGTGDNNEIQVDIEVQ
jgi:hypothetical protein